MSSIGNRLTVLINYLKRCAFRQVWRCQQWEKVLCQEVGVRPFWNDFRTYPKLHTNVHNNKNSQLLLGMGTI